MSREGRYPKLGIRSKNEIAKRISSPRFPYRDALSLLKDVSMNFDKYWHDNKKESEPEKEKYVRSAAGTSLGLLLSLINEKILAPSDELIPDFIYGGLEDRNHIQAAFKLLGKQKSRRLISMDIVRFFEQINEKRVFYFFYKKCHCSKDAASLLARLCCVPKGPKGSRGSEKVLGRGFATSSRLSVWCNMDTFLRIKWKAARLLERHDPELVVFVDDIGVSASNVTEERMDEVYKNLESILEHSDSNQALPVNPKKKKNITFAQGAEHLGLKLGRNKLTPGAKTSAKRDRVKNALQKNITTQERKKLLSKKKAYYLYKKQLQAPH